MKKIINIVSEYGSILINHEAIEVVKIHKSGLYELEGKELCKIIIYLKNSEEFFSGYIHWNQRSDFEAFMLYDREKYFSIYEENSIAGHIQALEIWQEIEEEEEVKV